MSLENLAVDVSELEKGIDATRRELEASRECHASGTVLETFLATAGDRMNMLNVDCKKAQVNIIKYLYRRTEVMFLPVCVCVCLSVCPLDYSKSHDPEVFKGFLYQIFGQEQLITFRWRSRNRGCGSPSNLLIFGAHSDCRKIAVLKLL